MQTIYLDFQQPGVPPRLKCKQNDRYSRFFKVVLLNGGTAFMLPEGAGMAVRYIAPSGSGWYDTITEIDNTTKHSAFSISGNEVTVELAEAMLTLPGSGTLWLQIYTATGYRIGTWNIPLEIEADLLTDSTIAASDYYNVLTAQVAQTLGYRDAAANSAAAAAASAALAQQISQQSKGWYATDRALKAAFPTGQNGWWAIVGAGDNIWTWDADTNAWVNTHTQTDLSNYYTKAQADAAFLGKTATAASATQLVTQRKIGDADFDGTKDITLAQMGIDLADTNYPITLAASVEGAGFGALSKNAIKGIRYKISLQVTKSVVVGSGNVLGTTNALLNADINLSVPCYVSQQGVGVYMGVLMFGTDKSIMLLCEHALTYTTGATYPIFVYACNQ